MSERASASFQDSGSELASEPPLLRVRTNALAAFRIRETGGVADDEHGVADHWPRRMRVQQIGVTFESRRRIGRNLALRLQPAAERVDVLDQALVAFAPEADVEEITLAEGCGFP